MADDEEAVPLPEEVSAPLEENNAVVTESIEQKQLDQPKYHIRPDLGEKYRVDEAAQWVKTITNNVRSRVQQLGHQRYRIIVQSFLMEMKGAGVKCAQRCIWDPETDSYVADSYRNETIMCHTAVYEGRSQRHKIWFVVLMGVSRGSTS
ncbi:Tctex1 domain-containing protein 2 [Eumeta japonica]|uniref:Tctex1 domain-containing protein 2 n=1 Tax=Eumeta variegata TaxID=151549 RepID=A0A4C1UN43_EUMVA|nr:Tctex1 domain-containing protein 2 [Eumeta japonica]